MERLDKNGAKVKWRPFRRKRKTFGQRFTKPPIGDNDFPGFSRRYRKVQETVEALQLVAAVTSEWGVIRCCWVLDLPVSNCGRLKALILDQAVTAGWPWDVQLTNNADRSLRQTDQVVVSSDAGILEICRRWVNLAGTILQRGIPAAWRVDLSRAGD